MRAYDGMPLSAGPALRPPARAGAALPAGTGRFPPSHSFTGKRAEAVDLPPDACRAALTRFPPRLERPPRRQILSGCPVQMSTVRASPASELQGQLTLAAQCSLRLERMQRKQIFAGRLHSTHLEDAASAHFSRTRTTGALGPPVLPEAAGQGLRGRGEGRAWRPRGRLVD